MRRSASAILAAVVAAVATTALAQKAKAVDGSNKYDCNTAPVVYSFTSTRFWMQDGKMMFHLRLEFGFDTAPGLTLVFYGYAGSANEYVPQRRGHIVVEVDVTRDPSSYADSREYVNLEPSIWGCKVGYGMTIVSTDLPVSPNDGCGQFDIIDTRGSGRPEGEISPPGQAFIEEFKRLHPGTRVDVFSNGYPASGGPLRLVGAVLSLPVGYHKSLLAGEAWLKFKIAHQAKKCPATPIYLVGYSQGAQVTGDVYQKGSWQFVSGVALFGDPSFNHQDKVADRGNFQRLDGGLHTRPLFSGLEEGHVLSFCHRHDPVCQGPIDFAELGLFRFSHHDYAKTGEAKMAAQYFSEH